jgi:hypothetical protein
MEASTFRLCLGDPIRACNITKPFGGGSFRKVPARVRRNSVIPPPELPEYRNTWVRVIQPLTR